MKKAIKQIMAATLCVAITASFVGCGKKEVADSNITTVSYWTTNGHNQSFIKDQITKWNETVGIENGVQIDYVMQTGDLSEKIDIAMTSNSAPEIFDSCDMEKLAEQDLIAAIEDLPEAVQKELFDKFGEYVMSTRHQVNGKTYILPKSTTTYGLIYNIDMFKAAGIVDENGEATPPETLAEVRDYAKRLTNAEKREYGIIFPGKFGAWYGCDVAKMAVPSCGYISGYNPATGTYDYSAEAEVIKMLMGIKRDGSYYPGVEGLDNDPARARFGEGGIGMKTAGSFDYGVLTEQFPAKINWGVAPYPALDKNNRFKQHMDLSGGVYMSKAALDKVGADKLAEAYKFFYSEDLIKAEYSKGMSMPLTMDWVEGVEIDESMPQAQNWKAFCEITRVSKGSPLGVKSETTGKRSLGKMWLEDIWPNTDITDDEIDAKAAEWTKTVNDGIAEYKKIHPDYDSALSIDSSWDATIKE